MTDHDDRNEIADLADRIAERLRRGEDPEFEFEIDYYGLTAAEQDDYLALMKQRTAHGQERLDALDEQVRALKALLVLNVDRAPGDVAAGGHR